MKSKLLTLLLLIGLLISTYGTAFAQGSQPPIKSSDLAVAKKSDFGVPSHDVMPTSSLNRDNFISATVTTTALSNGNFEQGRFVGWAESSAQGWPVVTPRADLPPTLPPHSGNWAAWLGGDDNETATVSQSNLLITSPTALRLWYWIASLDLCGYDFGYLEINNVPIYTWNLCQSNNTGGWRSLDLDLNAYNGQTITLTIVVNTGAAYPSSLYIDDVSLYSTFADVPYGYWSQSFIQSLYNAGVTGGCGSTGTPPLMYCPTTAVTRDQMAVFLLRGIHGPSYSPPDVAGSTGFVDVPPTYWAAAWIKELAAEGITGGCENGKYCPGSPVTRDQMAIFLLRAKHGFGYVPPAVTGVFTDVQANYWAAAWIEALASEGITSGCTVTPKQYCPGTAVTRDQMAVFLVRTFGLP
jgi:hypothetical protein